MTKFLQYHQNRLHYVVSGAGPVALLLFHGFGQDHHAFDEWIPALENEYTFYSFDLFFHGQSEWRSAATLEKSDWLEMLSLFLDQEKITRFAVAGYSLGGKFALATIESFPDRIDSIFLLAPDGIRINSWYTLATWPVPARRIFHTMIRHPELFQGVVRAMQLAGLVHNGVLRFASSQMDTEEKRQRVYNAWVCFRHLRFSMAKIAALINDRKIPTTFLLGRFDKMIQTKTVHHLIGKLHRKEVHVLAAGHNDLIRQAAAFLLPRHNHP